MATKKAKTKTTDTAKAAGEKKSLAWASVISECVHKDVNPNGNKYISVMIPTSLAKTLDGYEEGAVYNTFDVKAATPSTVYDRKTGGPKLDENGEKVLSEKVMRVGFRPDSPIRLHASVQVLDKKGQPVLNENGKPTYEPSPAEIAARENAPEGEYGAAITIENGTEMAKLIENDRKDFFQKQNAERAATKEAQATVVERQAVDEVTVEAEAPQDEAEMGA